MDYGRMGRPGGGDESSEIADARSQDRLELYLTPKGKLGYTLNRLKRYVSPVGPGDSNRDFHPYVRLYAPPLAQPWQSSRVEPVTQLRSASTDQLLLGAGEAGCTLNLGIKICKLEPGRYSASLLTSDPAGVELPVSVIPFQSDCPDAEWVLPPTPVWLAAGGRFRVLLARNGIDAGHPKPVYESLPVRVGNESTIVRQRHILGKAGTRMLDIVFALGATLALSLPFAYILLYVRHHVVTRFPAVAAARRASARGRILRFAAPALYRDESRWTWQNGALAEGPIYKIETLTPDKRPLLERMSPFMRGWGVDEWPQIIAIFSGAWSLFGPRAVPNRDGLLAPDGATVQNSRDLAARYRVNGESRKPGALSLRLALTPRGSIELPPWRTMLLYDRYDSTHWSLRHALQVLGRLGLSFLWGEASHEHHGPVQSRLARVEFLPGDQAGSQPQSANE